MRRILRSTMPFLVAATLASVGCGNLKELPTTPGDVEPPDPTATLSRVQREVFTPSCALSACHDTESQQQQLILSSGQAFAFVVGRPSVEIPSLDRVRPFDPEHSYLYLKITGDPIITGARMPRGFDPLSADQVKLIRDWIRRGAPND